MRCGGFNVGFLYVSLFVRRNLFAVFGVAVCQAARFVVGFDDLYVVYGVCMVQSIVIMVRNAEMVVDLAVCVVGSGGCECGMEGWGWFSGGFWVVFREFVIGNWGSGVRNGGF